MATEKTIVINAETGEAKKSVEALNKETSKTGQTAQKSKEDFSGLTGQIDKMTGGAVTGFKSVLRGAKSATTGFRTLRGAIISTGIGALVVLLVSAFEWFKNTEAGAKALDTALNAVGAVVGQLGAAFGRLLKGDFSGFIDEIAGIGDAVRDSVDATNDLYDAELKLFELRQRTIISSAENSIIQENLRNIIRDTTQSEEDRLAAVEALRKINNEILKEKLEELELQEKILRAELANENNIEEQKRLQEDILKIEAERIKLAGSLNSINEKANRRVRQIEEERIKEQEKAEQERIKAIQERNKLEEELLKETEKARIANLEDEEERIQAEFDLNIAGIREKYDKGTELEAELIKQRDAKLEELREAKRLKDEEEEKKRLERIKAIQDEFEDLTELERIDKEEQKRLLELEQLNATEEEKQRIRNFYADKRAKLEQDAIDQRLNEEEILKNQIIASTAQTFGEISNILGEQSKAGKAFAVAQALMNTYQGISAGVALGFPQAIPAIAAASATGFKAVKDIMSTNVESPSSSGGGGARGVSQPQAQAPAFNIVGDSGTNQIADVLGQNANEPSRAYVVSSDVTSSQELDRSIESSASL